MTSYNRRDVLKGGTGAALIAGGILAGGAVSTAGADEQPETQSLPEIDKPDGWTSYRGDPGNTAFIEDGHEFDGDLEVAWTRENQTDTIAVANDTDTVYTGTGDSVVALDVEDGSIEWENDDVAGTAPAITAETVYVSGHEVVALDRTDGSLQWETDFDAESISEPTVAYGAVYVAVDGTLYALEADDGAIRWNQEPDETESEAEEPEEKHFEGKAVADGLVYSVTGKSIVAFDSMTGEEVKRFELDTVYDISPPFAANSTAFALQREATVGSHRTYTLLFDVQTGEYIDGGYRYFALSDEMSFTNHHEAPGWTTGLEKGNRLYDIKSPHAKGQPVIVDDTAYVFSFDSIDAIDLNDGAEKWSFETEHDSAPSEIVVSGETMYLVGDELIAFREPTDETDDESTGESGNEGEDDTDCECDEDGDDDAGETDSDAHSDDSDGAGDGDSAGDDRDDGSDDAGTDDDRNDNSDATEDESNEDGTIDDDSDDRGGNESTDTGSDETSDNESTETEDESEGMPGFGVVTGLAGAAGGAALAARRRLSSDDDLTNRD